MKTLIGIPLIIFGIGWMAIVGLIYWLLAGSADIGAYFPIGPFFAIGLVALVIGLLFIVMGRADARKMEKEINHITTDGVAAKGSVTFVDNNGFGASIGQSGPVCLRLLASAQLTR